MKSGRTSPRPPSRIRGREGQGIRDGMPPIHPGEHLRDELEWLGMPASAFAAALGIPASRIGAILHGRRAITAEMALRLARYFGTTLQFWMNLQNGYDLKVAEAKIGSELEAIVPRAL